MLSPDGRYIAYSKSPKEGNTPPDVFVLAADGTQETVVAQSSAADSDPVWSPDGRHLVFQSDRTGSPSLWSVPMQEGKPAGPEVLIKANTGPIDPLGIARNGSLFYHLSGRQIQNVHLAGLNENLQSAGTPQLATDRFVNSNSGPAWSPTEPWSSPAPCDFTNIRPWAMTISCSRPRVGERSSPA